MAVPDAPDKFIDMRELGHFTHTQWNLEPYFLTKNGSSFQIYSNEYSFNIKRAVGLSLPLLLYS